LSCIHVPSASTSSMHSLSLHDALPISYLFYGQFENHVKFGMQFAVQAYQTYIPDTKEGLVAYLSSDLFYGVGKKTAERIIDQLGDRKSTRLNSSHVSISYAVFCLKKQK